MTPNVQILTWRMHAAVLSSQQAICHDCFTHFTACYGSVPLMLVSGIQGHLGSDENMWWYK